MFCTRIPGNAGHQTHLVACDVFCAVCLPRRALTQVNSSCWGSRVVELNGTFVMAVSESVGGCDLGTWRSNMQIAIATSSTPIGPFKKVGVAVPAWATNPALFVPPSGELVVATCGAGYECAPGATAWSTPNGSCHSGAKCPCVGPPAGSCHYQQNTTDAIGHLHATKAVRRCQDILVHPSPTRAHKHTRIHPPPTHTRTHSLLHARHRVHRPNTWSVRDPHGSSHGQLSTSH
jgi:hypothetical protein